MGSQKNKKKKDHTLHVYVKIQFTKIYSASLNIYIEERKERKKCIHM